MCFLLISSLIHTVILMVKFTGNPHHKRNQIEITLGGIAIAYQPTPKTIPLETRHETAKEAKRAKKHNTSKQVKKRARHVDPKTSVPIKRYNPPKIVTRSNAKKGVNKIHTRKKLSVNSPKKSRSHRPTPTPAKKNGAFHWAKIAKDARKTPPKAVASTSATPPVKECLNRPGTTIKQAGLKNYLSQVRQIIERHKYYPYNARIFGREGKVGVSFTIAKDGKIEQTVVKSPCKHKDLNRAALKTLRSSNPLPPPPKGLSPPLKVDLTLVFQLRS